MTQARADRMEVSLTQRITDRVNRVRPDRGMGHGPRGADRSSSAGGTSGGMGTPMSAPSTMS